MRKSYIPKPPKDVTRYGGLPPEPAARRLHETSARSHQEASRAAATHAAARSRLEKSGAVDPARTFRDVAPGVPPRS